MIVLIIGLGSIANKHINALRKIDSSIQIVRLRSSNTSSKVEGITDIYSLSEIPEFNFDFVIISNPTSLHVETIISLIILNCLCLLKKRYLLNFRTKS
jgi:predicted dehydrogenase